MPCGKQSIFQFFAVHFFFFRFSDNIRDAEYPEAHIFRK